MLSNPQLLKQQAYLNGEWRSAASGETLPVFNPADKTLVGEIPCLSREEVEQTIASAQRACLAWKKQTAKQRAEVLLAWRDEIKAAQQPLAELLVLEQGKPMKEALGEINYAASFVEWFAEEAKRAYGEIIPSHLPNGEIRVTKAPVGVVAAITPWNFPSAMITRKAAAALAAGCAFIVKPSELTPFSATALALLAERASFPPGLFNIVLGDAKIIGAELCENPTVRKLSFTGSSAVGKLLMRQVSPTLKRLSLELGGNAPFIVFGDAALERTVEQVMASKFRNSGQTCVCANRIFVEKTCYREFTERLKEKVAALKVGDGFEAGVEQGPLINEKAVEKVERQLEALKAAGARVLVGGKRHSLGGTFFEPTLLVDVPPSSLLDQEETFGPLAPVIPFENEAEVIRLANNTPYGLAAYVATENLNRAYRVAGALESGMVGVNNGIISTELAPFGGIKQSGFGREGARAGLEEYLQTKYTFFDYSGD